MRAVAIGVITNGSSGNQSNLLAKKPGRSPGFFSSTGGGWSRNCLSS
jgi:hypothetical protein